MNIDGDDLCNMDQEDEIIEEEYDIYGDPTEDDNMCDGEGWGYQNVDDIYFETKKMPHIVIT